MKWTLNEIETFLEVIDAGSISGAAARVNLSKSVVSKRVSEFELALGAPLFTRHAGRISPTDSAIALAERLRPALAELRAATESVAWGDTGLRGRLAITAPMSFGTRHLGPVIADFARMHPDLDLVLDLDDQISNLAATGHDIAIRVGRLSDSSLMARKLCEDPCVVVASPGYLDRFGPLTGPDALAGHPAINYSNVRLGQVWQFRQPVVLPRAGRIATNNGEAIRDMAIAGLGIALLPVFIAHEALRAGTLVRLLPELEPLPLPINAVWLPARPMPRKLRLFVDHLAQAFGDRPPWLTDLP
ncbi:LysR family transcriptional regulator [Tropicimonas sp. IMCC34043]|uniref:LysR family transcriptional regulator n=1 Tax=Tropicimonas sp. IMCC34043 TaxID=2248760 RepID=UPI000E261A9F|nr:LysR family transcriptional regulator [Tropicimonas sp. IMCC34043]